MTWQVLQTFAKFCQLLTNLLHTRLMSENKKTRKLRFLRAILMADFWGNLLILPYFGAC